MRRRCLWPGCAQRTAKLDLVYCHQHYGALTDELRTRLYRARGGADWMAALDACQAYAREVERWAKRDVTGGAQC